MSTFSLTSALFAYSHQNQPVFIFFFRCWKICGPKLQVFHSYWYTLSHRNSVIRHSGCPSEKLLPILLSQLENCLSILSQFSAVFFCFLVENLICPGHSFAFWTKILSLSNFLDEVLSQSILVLIYSSG